MPFIGKSPTAGFATIVKDTLTTNGSTTQFTLSKQVASATDIAVFVGNVRQEPTTAYTVSGTTLDFGSGNAPAAGLDMYVLHIGGTQESSIIPADNTISTAKLQSGAVTDAKIAAMAASKLTGALPAIDGSALTNVVPAPSANSIVQSIYSPFNAVRKSFSNSSTYVSSGHSVSITPQYSNSMIELELHVVTNTGSNNVQIAFHETTSSSTDLGSKTYTGDHAGWRTVSQMLQVASTGTTARTFEPYVKSASAIYGIQTTTTTAPGHSGAVLIAREISQ